MMFRSSKRAFKVLAFCICTLFVTLFTGRDILLSRGEHVNVRSPQGSQTDRSAPFQFRATRSPKENFHTSNGTPGTAGSTSSFAVISFCHGERYADLRKWAKLNHASYAKRHGYDFIEGDDVVFPHAHFITPLSWAKAALLWQLVQTRHNQWFILADCDALYTRMNETVSHLLADLGISAGDSNATHVVVASDIGGSPFNAGVVLVRNTAWSKKFLARVLLAAGDKGVREHPWWEQHAMHDLYRQNATGEQIHIRIVDRARFQAFTINEGEFKLGTSFIRHQVNCPGHPANHAKSLAECAANQAKFMCSVLHSDFSEECDDFGKGRE